MNVTFQRFRLHVAAGLETRRRGSLTSVGAGLQTGPRGTA